MMRNVLSIVVVAAYGMIAGAASVPQDSASKYYFTVPVASNLIHGVVMGDPPAYSAMRYEDVAWIAEAEAERNALAAQSYSRENVRRLVPTFGRWQISETNRFAKWTTAEFIVEGRVVTNIVAGYNFVTNTATTAVPRIGNEPPSVTIAEGYLTTSTNLWNQNVVAVVKEVKNYDTSWPLITNVVTTVSTNWLGGYIGDDHTWHYSEKTNISYITMAMTNGTVSVHTNIWNEIVPVAMTTVNTQIVRQGWADLLFVGKKKVPYEWSGKKAGGNGKIFRTSPIEECYRALRGAKRLAMDGENAQANFASPVSYIAYQSWDYDSTEGSVEPNYTREYSTDYQSLFLSKEFSANSGESRYTPDNDSGEEETVSRYGDGYLSIMGYSDAAEYYFEINAPTNAYMAGGVDRIASATLYVGAHASFVENLSVNSDTVSEEWKIGWLLYRVGTMTKRGIGQRGRIMLSCSVSPGSILDSAAAAVSPSGFPSVNWIPVFPSAPSQGMAAHDFGISVEISKVIIVLDLRPWTSLTGW